MAMIPQNKPKQTEEFSRAILQSKGVDTDKPALLGIRGYYLNTMGKPEVNDRGLYDDAIFVVGPEQHAAFNANTDPSGYAYGRATLKAGLWKYKIGIHGLSKPVEKRYIALVQAAPVTVTRDGKEDDDTGYFGINIHRGGDTTTSSLGCQTIPPKQWVGFFDFVQHLMSRYGAETIPYLLIENV